MKTVTIREAQHNLSKILQEVEAGATVQITRRRTPVARLIPEPSTATRRPAVDWSNHSLRLIKPTSKAAHHSSDELLLDLRGDR